MKFASRTADQQGWALLWSQGRVLALVLASTAALMGASVVGPVVLMGIAALAVLTLALLHGVGSPSRHMALKTIGAVCGCAIAMELVFLALQNVTEPHLSVGLILFLSLVGVTLLLMEQGWFRSKLIKETAR